MTLVYAFGVSLVTILILMSSEATSFQSSNFTGLLEAMPKQCSGTDYCLWKHPKYPQKRINHLISNELAIRLATFRQRIRYTYKYKTDNEQADCLAEVYPYDPVYEIIDHDGRVRIVVQSPRRFEQIVRVERCTTPGRILEPTTHIQSPHLYNVSCEDTMLDYSFWVLTIDGKGVELVESRSGIPVFCRCQFNGLTE